MEINYKSKFLPVLCELINLRIFGRMFNFNHKRLLINDEYFNNNLRLLTLEPDSIYVICPNNCKQKIIRIVENQTEFLPKIHVNSDNIYRYILYNKEDFPIRIK